MAAFSFKAALCSSAFALCSMVMAPASMAEDELLRVGTESSYAPFEFTDSEGKLVGFDIDLAEAVVKQMGGKIEWVQMPFDGLIPAMLTSQVDMAVASFTVTEERKKRINFSDPYYRSGLTFVIKKDDNTKYTTVESLKGKKICAQLGSVSAMKAQTLSPDNVATFNDAYAAYLELKAGGCEAVLNDRPVNQFFLSNSKTAGDFVEINELMDAEDMAMVIPKNNEELLAEVNKALAELKANGTYDKIFAKWFGDAAKTE